MVVSGRRREGMDDVGVIGYERAKGHMGWGGGGVKPGVKEGEGCFDTTWGERISTALYVSEREENMRSEARSLELCGGVACTSQAHASWAVPPGSEKNQHSTPTRLILQPFTRSIDI